MEDIEIARNTNLENIMAISEKAGIAEDEIEQYGKNKAKITYKEKSITLPTVKKNGVEYVKVTSLYKGLGFKTQWQKLSKTMSIGA